MRDAFRVKTMAAGLTKAPPEAYKMWCGNGWGPLRGNGNERKRIPWLLRRGAQRYIACVARKSND